MLKKISSYVSVKETDMYLSLYAKLCGYVGEINTNTQISRYFLMMKRVFENEEIIERSREVAAN